MASKTGTFDITSLMAARGTNTLATELDAEEVRSALDQDNANYAAIVTDMLGDLAETNTSRQATVGSSASGSMMEVDEYSEGPTQKDLPGYFIYFPLRKFQYPTGWTEQWAKRATLADFASKNTSAQIADSARMRYEIQRAIYTPTNYTFLDHLVDNASLAVKAFINADSTSMQNGPNGEVFDGTSHTHYDAIAALTAASLTAQINDIAEHRNGTRIQININTADVATVSALTGFVPLQYPYLTINANANQVATPRLNMEQVDNRQIGWFGSAQVWTKPWAVANYSVAVDLNAPMKPLRRRVEDGSRGFHLASQWNVHPLHASYYENFYGFAARNRTALHVLRFNNASYAAPTLTPP